MVNNLVKFYTGTAAAYASLATKDENTLYFITDARMLYKGSTPFGGGSWEAVTSFPATGDAGTVYVNTATGEVKWCNGTGYVQVVKPYSTALRETGATNDALVTEKAVVDYIAARLTDLDVSTLEGRVNDVEAALDGVYTKTEADAAITTAIGKANHLKREIVQVLPDVADANEQTIYMVSIANGTANQKYEEFMLINGTFEKIGDSAVDLTNYPTTTQVDKKVADSLKSAKDYADGLASNYATAAQGALADTALQPADVTTGTTNGTISVDGTEISVAGLKSAAYTESSAYDAAGAADTALANAKKYVDDALTWKELGTSQS